MRRGHFLLLLLSGLGIANQPLLQASETSQSTDQPLSTLDGGKVAVIEKDVNLWSDRQSVAAEWPESLRGLPFVQSSIDKCRVRVEKAGHLLVVTPLLGQRGGFSEEEALRKAGFARVDVEPFLPFSGADSNGDTCCVYQKQVASGDVYERRYRYGITLWRQDPLPPEKPKPPLPSSECAARVTPPNPPNEGILFVDHSPNNRSGHLGQALTECNDGTILAFYPNCSDDNAGHSAVGWMEYKRSKDGGETWGPPQVLEFSKALHDQRIGRTAMAEKAVTTHQGSVILFYLICDVSENPLWQPYWVPVYSKSTDGGQTWSEPAPVSATRGRIYDAVYEDGEIRVLHFANDATADWTGTTEDHVYEFYVSTDGGETFVKRSELPLMTKDRGYGSLGRLDDGRIIAYVYNRTDEFVLDYMTSADDGRTWSEVQTARFSRKIRNPQFIAFNGKYYMHGRSGAYGDGKGHMILYMSDDGVTWDNGVYLRMAEAGPGAYSNSIIVRSRDGKVKDRLLIQASHAYRDNMTDVLHWWLD